MPDIEAMYHVSDQDFARLEWSIDPKNQQASNSPPPVLYTFKSSWSDFIDSLVSEWQFQNVVSAVLLSAVLTMLQIGSVEADILCRTMAIVSLICSLMSILYCCVFIARFGLMKKLHRAASWAEVCYYWFPVYFNAHDNHLGNEETANRNPMECLGILGHANYLACMVSLFYPYIHYCDLTILITGLSLRSSSVYFRLSGARLQCKWTL
jgi:hypothetical protein